MSIYLFCEGQTEKNVVEKLITLSNPKVKGGGKAQVNNQMTDTLGRYSTNRRRCRHLLCAM